MDLMHYYHQHLEQYGKRVLDNPAQENDVVYVKYLGIVDLAHFVCYPVSKSSLVKYLCYSSKENGLIVNLKGTYYAYCEVPARVFAEWLTADSMGKFFDVHIKHNYGCKVSSNDSPDE